MQELSDDGIGSTIDFSCNCKCAPASMFAVLRRTFDTFGLRCVWKTLVAEMYSRKKSLNFPAKVRES